MSAPSFVFKPVTSNRPSKTVWRAPEVVELDVRSVKGGPGQNEQFTPEGTVSSGGAS